MYSTDTRLYTDWRSIFVYPNVQIKQSKSVPAVLLYVLVLILLSLSQYLENEWKKGSTLRSEINEQNDKQNKMGS